MAERLKKFTEPLNEIPQNLKRSYKIIRDLDDRVTQLQAHVDEQCRQQVQSLVAARSGSKRQRTEPVTVEAVVSPEIESAMQQALSIAEEKTRIAQQVYDKVDGIIRALDADLQAYEAEINGDRAAMGLRQGQTASSLLGLETGAPAALLPSGAAVMADAKGGGARQRRRGAGRRRAPSEGGDAAGAEAGAMPAVPTAAADSSEPRYCFCNNVSYGNMIACDSEDCRVEWFHFQCVGIKSQPRGKWYCPECTKLRKAAGRTD